MLDLCSDAMLDEPISPESLHTPRARTIGAALSAASHVIIA